MSKFIYIATLLLLISWCHASTDDDSSSESSDDSPKASETTESKAGEAIKTLLQEKITQKFKEAANEVKGVLVKQLGDSLKSAHEAFNPPKDKEKKIADSVGAKAASAASSAKNSASGSGAAKVHQNKANRHRKNSGPQGTPQKPPIEAKIEAKTGEDDIEKDVSPFQPPIPPPMPPKPLVPSQPPPPPSGGCSCEAEPPCGMCGPQNTQTMVSHIQLPQSPIPPPAIPPPMPPPLVYAPPPPPLPPPPPPPMSPCNGGPCNQVCGPMCQITQCCPSKKSKVSKFSLRRKKI